MCDCVESKSCFHFCRDITLSLPEIHSPPPPKKRKEERVVLMKEASSLCAF